MRVVPATLFASGRLTHRFPQRLQQTIGPGKHSDHIRQIKDFPIRQADLAEWRRSALAALGGVPKAVAGGGEARRVRELEKQLRRKDKALAEAAALLVLQKKVQSIWGDEDDDTNKEPDK